MNLKTLRLFVLILPIAVIANGCTTAVVAGAAAAGGYIAHDKGYRVQNPVTKPSGTKEENSE